MPDHPLKDSAEIEITCPRCGYRMMRTAARLRRETSVVCPSCGEPIVPNIDAHDSTIERSTPDDI